MRCYGSHVPLWYSTEDRRDRTNSFNFYYSLNSNMPPNHNYCTTVLFLGQLSFSYMSAKIYFLPFSFYWDQLSKEPLAHGTWTQVQSSFSPLWIPFFVFLLINSPFWSYSTVGKKMRSGFCKSADGWIWDTPRQRLEQENTERIGIKLCWVC